MQPGPSPMISHLLAGWPGVSHFSELWFLILLGGDKQSLLCPLCSDAVRIK